MPADCVGLERIAGNHLAVGITALQTLERAALETFRTRGHVRCNHPDIAFKAARPPDRQELRIRSLCCAHGAPLHLDQFSDGKLIQALGNCQSGAGHMAEPNF